MNDEKEVKYFMNQSKIFSSLCYFSLFFAPILVPIIMYYVVDDSIVKKHAKSSMLSHLILLVLFIAMMLVAIFVAFEHSISIFWFLISIGAYFVISIIVVIWNVIKGIKILAD